MRQGKDIFNHVWQVGFIVKDANKTIESMKKVFGAEPDAKGNVAPSHKLYHGKPAEFDSLILLYNFADVQLEFIQPLSGLNIWQEHLDKHGEGLHHVCFTVDDYEEAESYLAGLGIKPLQQGDSLTPNMRWDYFDTEDELGFILETRSKRNKE